MAKPLRMIHRKSDDLVEPGKGRFWHGMTVAELAEVQGVQPVQDPSQLWGDFWPEDESLESFVQTIRESRHQDAA